jgi:diguanylate cyclase (GGDEF)-like protein
MIIQCASTAAQEQRAITYKSLLPLALSRYQSVIAACSQTLLPSAWTTAEQRQMIEYALLPVREALAVDRISVWFFHNKTNPHGSLILQTEIIANDLPAIPNPIDQPYELDWLNVPEVIRNCLLDGQSVSGLTIDLYHENPTLLHQRLSAGMVMNYAIPIATPERFCGILGLDHRTPRTWPEEDIALLHVIAEMLAQVFQRWEIKRMLRSSEEDYRALALDHARQYHAAQRRADQVEMLRQAAAAVAGSLDRQIVIDQVLTHLARVIPYDTASVQIRNGSVTQVIGCRGFPDPNAIVGMAFPIHGNTLNEMLYQEAIPIHLNETNQIMDFLGVVGVPIRSWIGLPLKIEGQVIGILTLDGTAPDRFQEEHLQLGTAFADQVAIALHHTTIHAREVRARKRLTMLQHAMQAVSRESTSLNRLGPAIHRAIADLLPVDALTIALTEASPTSLTVLYHAIGTTILPPLRLPRTGSSMEQIMQQGSLFWDKQKPAPNLQTIHPGMRSGIASTLIGHSGILGIIDLQSTQENAYDEDDVTLLTLLAAHAATAIETARLFADLERLAHTDSLTGLLNRRAFFQHFNQEITQAQRTSTTLAICMLDIDHFKQINDTYGHAVGDQTLRSVAGTCQRLLRPSDSIGRYGGEEFIILLTDINAESGMHVTERLRRAIELFPIEAGSISLNVTVSIGMTIIPPNDTLPVLTRIDQADQALYQAKQQGRNQVVLWQP